MTAKEFYKWCEERGACKTGLRYIKGKTPAQFWARATRGDWMLWVVMYRLPGSPGEGECCDIYTIGMPFENQIGVDRRFGTRKEFLESSLEAANAYRKAFGNPFLKTRKRKSEVA